MEDCYIEWLREVVKSDKVQNFKLLVEDFDNFLKNVETVKVSSSKLLSSFSELCFFYSFYFALSSPKIIQKYIYFIHKLISQQEKKGIKVNKVRHLKL